MKVLFALQMTYHLAHLTLKTSILLLYKRIFTFISQPFIYAWHAVLAYVICCAITGLIVSPTQCKPIQYSWEQPLGTNGSCVDLIAAELGSGVTLMAADVMILVLPMPMLWSLHVKWARKIQLCALFGIGFLFAESFRDFPSDFLHHLLTYMQCRGRKHHTDSIHR